MGESDDQQSIFQNKRVGSTSTDIDTNLMATAARVSSGASEGSNGRPSTFPSKSPVRACSQEVLLCGSSDWD